MVVDLTTLFAFVVLVTFDVVREFERVVRRDFVCRTTFFVAVVIDCFACVVALVVFCATVVAVFAGTAAASSVNVRVNASLPAITPPPSAIPRRG